MSLNLKSQVQKEVEIKGVTMKGSKILLECLKKEGVDSDIRISGRGCAAAV